MKTYRITLARSDLMTLRDHFFEMWLKMEDVGSTSTMVSYDVELNSEDISYLKLKLSTILIHDTERSNFV